MSTHFELPLGDPIPFPGCDLTRAHEEVRCLARAALRRVQEARPDWTPPPFEPEIVANALGIAVHTRSGPLEWDAIMVPIGEETRIICNAAVRSPGRRRFSVAHEIAHAFFRDAAETYHLRTRNRDQYYRTEEARQLERLCDLGAVELLMPGDHVSKCVGRIGFRAAAIPEIARAFGVSLQAAAIRLVELAAEPCAAGFFQYGSPPSLATEAYGSKPEPKSRNAYRATRIYRSAGFPFLFPKGKSVADESSIYRASMRYEETEAVESFHLGRLGQRLHVTALGLHRDGEVSEPPTVCVFLRLTGCGAAGAEDTACRIETGS
jgi:Zn-dependent peptidase ImmA (M78 family)